MPLKITSKTSRFRRLSRPNPCLPRVRTRTLPRPQGCPLLFCCVVSYVQLRIATFSEFSSRAARKSDDEEDEGQEFFAGGEKSGIAMKGGPKQKTPPDVIKDILTKAGRGGPPPEEKKEKKSSYFSGSGNRLGSENSTESSSSVSPAVNPIPRQQDITEVAERQLIFWKNGFSIDDGPLRSYDDPEGKEFLEAINNGRAPLSMLNVQVGQQVEVRVAHRMEENYQPPPKQPAKPYSGTGNRLGAVNNSATSSNTQIPGSFPGGLSQQPVITQEAISYNFSVNFNEPHTQIQIRLADGTRMVTKINHTHTVGDIRRFVIASRPGESSRPFALMTAIPPVKPLSDDSVSVKDAGLINAVVVQKLI
ncbi:hypothetical protein HK096_007931 [Nowakowskiella sp. JEL0078]|nr:hypothetical protein HK096_007931 [Nowakowskiella sp. JEL0078]